MNTHKSIALAISSLIFCSITLMAQSNTKDLKIIKNGDTVLVKVQPRAKHSKTKEAKKEYLTVSDVAYDEAKQAREKYKKEG